MNKIIPLNDKLKQSARQKDAERRERKIRAACKVFQCCQCASKCERCGSPVERPSERPHGGTVVPYHFCAGCREEYLDYIKHLQGSPDPEAYWHNHHWLKVWQNWIEYQGAKDQYLRSKEFRRLVEELGPDHLKCE